MRILKEVDGLIPVTVFVVFLFFDVFSWFVIVFDAFLLFLKVFDHFLKKGRQKLIKDSKKNAASIHYRPSWLVEVKKLFSCCFSVGVLLLLFVFLFLFGFYRFLLSLLALIDFKFVFINML